ncbi:glycosyltransferase family 4 protein [Methylocaldum marinum]|uniref:glycosyltransferase family 4 protein n=1 Tax=Methylocaldum marinum TaxID=1432792 RepID=UPI0018D59C86|nr:glycosyltransferase family 4 protein [Methylocaldum marinum]
MLLSRYGQLGASSRLRSYQYLPYLESRGFRFRVAPFFKDAYLERFYAGGGKSLRHAFGGYGRRIASLSGIRAYDLIWIEAEALPWLPAWAETAMARAGTPYVVDYDDAIFHRYDYHANPAIRRILGDKIDRVMRHSKAVIAGSEYLAARATAAGAARVELVPTSIDLSRYPQNPSDPGAVFTIGWIGSPTTAQYLRSLTEVFSAIARYHPVRIIVIGAGTADLQSSDFDVEYRHWSEQTEVDDILRFDIGIMPLSDTPWERGKCGYKLIQYMGCHKPVVASPVGANLKIVEHGTNGFLASTESEWRTALLELLHSPDLRARLGRAGRALVEREYCTAVNGPKLANILCEASGR